MYNFLMFNMFNFSQIFLHFHTHVPLDNLSINLICHTQGTRRQIEITNFSNRGHLCPSDEDSGFIPRGLSPPIEAFVDEW
jgi:hypothetical protein